MFYMYNATIELTYPNSNVYSDYVKQYMLRKESTIWKTFLY